MKRTLIILLLLAAALSMPVRSYAREVDYMELMLTAAAEGDWAAGQYAQFARDEKIAAEAPETVHIAYEDLFLLARAMTGGCCESCARRIGETILYRRGDPDWPDTVAGVLDRMGWLEGEAADRLPDRESARLAQRLLEEENGAESLDFGDF